MIQEIFRRFAGMNISAGAFVFNRIAGLEPFALGIPCPEGGEMRSLGFGGGVRLAVASTFGTGGLATSGPVAEGNSTLR